MKKAFTLIELISVIIILSIIALISVPITTNIINSSRNKAYEETINNIIEISKNYSVYNNLGYNTLYKELTFDELSNKGYIESSDIINPKTNQKLAGCVIYRWVIGSNQYEFKYDETCNGKASYPEIVINVTPDSESWITEKPTFDIEGEYDSFKYCIEESECNPNIDYNNRVTVEKESKNLIICATGYNNKEVGKTTCTKGYKVDRTNPTLTYNITTSTNKIIVNASCTDDISGISKKEYSINDKEYQDNNTFPNLSKGTYKISVKCTDNAGLITVKSSNVALENIKNPVIAQLSQIPANTSYAQQRIIKINYSSEGIENPEYYFKSSVAASVASGVVVQSCGTGNTPSTCTTSSVTSLVANTWYRTNASTVNVTYTSNGTLYAVTKDNTNISGTSTYTIANIESSNPSIPSITYNGGSNTHSWKNNYNLTLSSSASSGIAYYEIDVDNNGTSDGTTGSNFIPVSGWSTCNARFRAVSNVGRKSEWTDTQHIHMDTESPNTFEITETDVGIDYITLKSNTVDSLSGISYYNYFYNNVSINSTENAKLTNLKQDTTYTIYVTAYDNASNYITSNTITVKTLSSPKVINTITSLYQNGLGRAGTQSEINAWYNIIYTNGTLLEKCHSIQNSFANSQEFSDRHKTNEDIIRHLYYIYYGRDVDSTGLELYNNLLNTGWTKNDVMNALTNSTEGINYCNNNF